MPKGLEETFWSKVDVLADGCWEWPNARGWYGQFSYEGRKFSAHRMSYEINHGPIPNGLVVRHKCGNKPCVHPVHIELGTPSDNAMDEVIRGRHLNALKTHCPYGHEYSKENTYIDRKGARLCRSCHRNRQRQYYRTRKQAA